MYISNLKTNILFVIFRIHWNIVKVYSTLIFYKNSRLACLKKYLLFFYKSATTDNAFLYTKINNGEETNMNKLDLADCDFIIYKTLVNDINARVIIDGRDDLKFNTNNQINISTVKFLAVFLNIVTDKIDITRILTDKTHHFYVENNKLFSPQFIKWFCKKYINIKYLEDYTIEFINDSIDNIKIKPDEFMLIKKHDYSIEKI